jgi:hypothetical protein
MLVVGCYALFELHVGSANKHLPEYIFVGMGNILRNNWARLIYFQLLDIWETRKKSKVETRQEIVNLLPYELFIYLSPCPVIYVCFGD